MDQGFPYYAQRKYYGFGYFASEISLFSRDLYVSMNYKVVL